MRLTLRTLLAYLDDTLDPEQAKLIGQKVAESPVAQELIERIKKVTRRRSLANPPVLGESSRLDPNSVAEYLDSQLGAEELSQVEQTCLEDDVYLAEVAACHQILTLMLSEPARVPPTAKQRMYRLVKGREAIPYRKPPAFPADASRDGEMERIAEHGPARWPLYVGGALLLLAGLVVAIYLAWPPAQPFRKNAPRNFAAVMPTSKEMGPENNATKKGEPNKSGPASNGVKVDAAKSDASKSSASKTDATKLPPPPPPGITEPEKKSLNEVPNKEPSSERKEIGEYVSPASALIEKPANGKADWRAVVAKSQVASGNLFVSLPGSQSDIKLDSDVQVTLWGNLLEYLPLMEFESAIVLHAAPAGFDADLTLQRGRIIIKSLKNSTPAKVRLRFRDEVWDLTLAANSEVIVDLLMNFGRGDRFSKIPRSESPAAQMFLGVPKGHVTVQVRDMKAIELHAPPGPALIGWDNRGKVQSPAVLKQAPPHWTFVMPTKSPAKEAAAEMKTTIEALVERLKEDGATPNLALSELADAEKPSAQLYAAFSLPAIDKIKPLVDSLDDLTRPALRGAAVISLRNWIAREAGNGLVLHRMLMDQKGYSEPDADAVLQLLHSFSDEDVAAPSTYDLLFGFLNNDRLSIRELALWHLVQLDPEGARLANYNPLQDERTAAINRWKKRLTEGKIPTLKPPKAASSPFDKPKPKPTKPK